MRLAPPPTSREERALINELLLQPSRNRNRWTSTADRNLRHTLFRSLAGIPPDQDHRHHPNLRYFFPHGPPAGSREPWSLRAAQGAMDGAEYTAAAKGTACGHIFRSGESTYHCKTCAADDTCVLCARCFEASDHEGHTVFISVSPGNSGCCDCGDQEAWRREVTCTIHSLDVESGSAKRAGKEKVIEGPRSGEGLPDEVVEAVRMTIARVVDYLCDVFSCSPEQLRQPKTEETIRQDEVSSRLSGIYGEEPLDAEPEFSLILWNDEKHTLIDVEDQVARACSATKKFGFEKAMEVNDIGRSIVYQSTDIPELLRMAAIIEHLKLTVTIRASRDTFREQMCATMIDWIADIAGCSVGSDAALLRNVVCEELLKPWRTGSRAPNREIGREGIDDHEIEDMELQRRRYHHAFNIPLGADIVFGVDDDEVADEGVDGEMDEDDDDDDEFEMELDDDLEFDVEQIRTAARMAMDAHMADANMVMDRLDDDEDGAAEVFEATFAGYPPPPPPPPAPNAGQQRRVLTPVDSDDGDPEQNVRPDSHAPYENVPKTPRIKTLGKRPARPSKHWLDEPEGFRGPRPTEPCEDLWQRVRLDFLILYDLRLWKTLRINLRHLYITTVVTIPRFKRILGLRFAGLYTTLAQLYLIADREPDHSIINLSIQMLTTPTITHEVVERGNFLTNLMAILFTFLTTRQVGFPENINPRATLAFNAGAVANRRMFHFFLDLRWLFQSEFVLHRMRIESRYLLQFLDLVKLHQGVCPNVRATGEHVEYENDTWISASPIVKEINKLCKQVAASFEVKPDASDGNVHLIRAIRTVAQITMINSFGYERKRFVAAEHKDDLAWHTIGPFDDSGKVYSVPKHIVQREPMSFHHPLHYLLSWLIENVKDTSRDSLRGLLRFSHEDLKDPWNIIRGQAGPHTLTPDELLSSIFDHPLRVCVWLGQMKTGMWVRNGITLRHQAQTYRSVSYRDVGYQRDLFMLQAAFVLCGAEDELPGERFLAQMIDRFQMTPWFRADYAIVPGFEEMQQIEVIEDFFHLLVVVLSERGNLVSPTGDKTPQERILQHDIAHALCFKPLSFSDLSARVTEKVGESDDFDRVLANMTIFRPPEGLNDTGTFELKPENIEIVNPYYAHYSRNHREEAEQLYKKHMAKKTGKRVDDVVYEPSLAPLTASLFASLPAFTATPLFAQIIAVALNFALGAKTNAPAIPHTRVESFLHMVLHLVLIATMEDESGGADLGFVKHAAQPRHAGAADVPAQQSIISALVTLSGADDYTSCHAAIKLVLRKMQSKQPEKVLGAMGPAGSLLDRATSGSPASLSIEDKERKRQESQARQARVMAKMREQQNSFLQNQGLSGLEDSFDELDDDISIISEPQNLEQKKIWEFPTGNCIWCQEETDDNRLYGTFAFVGESDIIRSTPIDDVDFVKEVLAIPRDLDRSAEHLRPFGVAGQNKHIVQKVSADGKVSNHERQTLSKGFPHQEHGIRGPVVTGCGHIMHYNCFELYLAHSMRRHTQQIARNHPENIELKEFICPLCKALGNTFMPIIWRAKECAQEHELHAAKSFDDWLAASKVEYPIHLPLFERAATAMPRHQRMLESYSRRSRTYVTNMCAPALAAGMSELSLESNALEPAEPAEPPGFSVARAQSFARIFGRGRSESHQSVAEAVGLADHAARVSELAKAYHRIDETICANHLHKVDLLTHSSGFNVSAGDVGVNPIGPLSRSLGMSISAWEIAHRGASNSPSAISLLADLSEQNVTHFRILSETIQSFLAIKTLRPSSRSTIAREAMWKQDAMTAQLFCVDNKSASLMLKERAGHWLFQDDTFLFFVDWLTFLAPNVAEATNVLQLCYWAEIVKTIAVYTRLLEQGLMSADLLATVETSSTIAVPPAFAAAVSAIVTKELGWSPELAGNQKCLALLYAFVQKYALAFLRKSIVAMSVRYGLDFECPYNLDAEMPELQRLTALLHLGPFEETCGIFATSYNSAGDCLRQFTRQWLWQLYLTISSESRGLHAINLPHPAIFELVGLPKNYDTLTEEALKGRCPTTGKDVVDPAICLSCGAIVCSQAVCCIKDQNQGGCFQHLQRHKTKVGIFLNVRKGMILFLHGPGNGSFLTAPYLDKHGEPDPILRRRHQLFLHPRRYDKLMREVWLSHLIPTVISRKLEADVNPGGWDTL